MRFYAYSILISIIILTTFFVSVYFRRLYYLILLKKYRENSNSKKINISLNKQSLRPILFGILLVTYIMLSPSIFAFRTSLNYNDCPFSENKIELYEEGTNLLIIQVNELTDIKEFSPYIDGHTPTDKLFYNFSVIENLDNSNIYSSKLLTNTPVNDFQLTETQCSYPNSKIITGHIYIAILKYRDPNIEYANSDPRVVERDDYVIVNIVDISSYDSTRDYLSQDDSIQSIINEYLYLIEWKIGSPIEMGSYFFILSENL